MTSGLAAQVTIHDPDVIGVDSEAEAALLSARLAQPRLGCFGSSRGVSASAPGDDAVTD